MEGLIEDSGQTKKYRFGINIALVGAFIVILGIFFGTQMGISTGMFLLGILFAVSGGMFSVFAVKCPICDARWVLPSGRRNPKTRKVAPLLGLKNCPHCDTRFDGE